MTNAASTSRAILVVGGQGFLGGYIVAALRARGWRVVCAVRPRSASPDDGDTRSVDLSKMQAAESWREILDGIDGVVNVAGILREVGKDTFEAIHVGAPAALAKACVETGIRNFVQISALGQIDDGEFIASKYRFDALMLQLAANATVLRPSVVYATTGSYGGTSLLRALAGFPGFSPLPADGRWLLQPVAAEDLGELVAIAIERNLRGIYEVGGPDVISLRDYQAAWRRWMRIVGTRFLQVPEALVNLQVWIGERLGRGPTGETMWRMLRRNNVLPTGAKTRLQEDFGFVPRALDQ
ncbi:MAG TPA: NAD-dependent epimerase/dehydratase family protein, partial [Dokdonella sp.]|uniref:NAD-dependent epimerase/dehydratase family protein n=1 Tax=Dokdonella sp. TaxID=2291710 RepID=UPI002D80C92B